MSRLFVGGISFDTSENHLKEYFSYFGDVVSCFIVYNKPTGISKGYGFIVIDGAKSVQKILEHEKHWIRGRLVDVSRTLSNKKGNNIDISSIEYRRLFVGGLSPDVSSNLLFNYFSTYGVVLNAFVINDPIYHVSKGFGYVEFGEVDTAEKVIRFKNHMIFGKPVKVNYRKNSMINFPNNGKGETGRKLKVGSMKKREDGNHIHDDISHNIYKARIDFIGNSIPYRVQLREESRKMSQYQLGTSDMKKQKLSPKLFTGFDMDSIHHRETNYSNEQSNYPTQERQNSTSLRKKKIQANSNLSSTMKMLMKSVRVSAQNTHQVANKREELYRYNIQSKNSQN